MAVFFLIEEHAQVGKRDITTETSIRVFPYAKFLKLFTIKKVFALTDNDFTTGLNIAHFIAIPVAGYFFSFSRPL